MQKKSKLFKLKIRDINTGSNKSKKKTKKKPNEIEKITNLYHALEEVIKFYNN